MPPTVAQSQLRKPALFKPAKQMFRLFRGPCPETVADDPCVNILFPANAHQFEEIVIIDKWLPGGETHSGNTGDGHLPDDFLGLGKPHFFNGTSFLGCHAMGTSDIAGGCVSERYISHDCDLQNYSRKDHKVFEMVGLSC